MVFDKYINDDDQVMLNHFNTRVFTDVPLSKKRNVAESFVEALKKLHSPNGGTAFYDAVHAAASSLKQSRSKSYIVGLTDGEDNSSSKSPLECAALLRECGVAGMIVISVEGEGNAKGFNIIAGATKLGTVLTTADGAQGISRAFSEVAKLISGDVVLVCYTFLRFFFGTTLAAAAALFVAPGAHLTASQEDF
jgi:imidazole glycerol phosphate synthase subunit HisF